MLGLTLSLLNYSLFTLEKISVILLKEKVFETVTIGNRLCPHEKTSVILLVVGVNIWFAQAESVCIVWDCHFWIIDFVLLKRPQWFCSSRKCMHCLRLSLLDYRLCPLKKTSVILLKQKVYALFETVTFGL